MIWIPIVVFMLVLLAVAGGYFLLWSGKSENVEVKKRISLLELRNLQDADVPDLLKKELLSEVPLLNQILSRVNIATRIDRRLRQADMEMKVGTFLLLSLSLFFVGIVAGWILHWPTILSIVVGIALLTIPHLIVNIKRRRRLKQFMNHFPEALEMFARSLRAGHSFTGAIQLVAQEMPDPIGPEFSKVFEEQNLGIPLRQALIGMTDRVDILDVKFFVTAILIQRETGGNLAEIIDKIAYVIRERFRIQGQLKIFTAQARLSGVILSLLPIGVAVLVGILNPEYLKPLWFEKVGRVMIAIGATLQILGMLAIRKIIRIKI
ncbi:type II secretion system F family protein [Candidatus Deferrimicrobium sp.]|uniref:type II secretion system F family protein n=1 Tax=Candidatus Deferrimicrobium sp. TaxID=3060586 RepID=UPI002ED53DE6